MAIETETMPRPTFSKELREEVYAKTSGKCFHCNATLKKGWHVDHHPIPFRDIEENVLKCCAITDPVQVSNLQPSCPSCNTSHKFEPANKLIFCGHTQPFVKKIHTLHAMWLCTSVLSFVTGVFISYKPC